MLPRGVACPAPLLAVLWEVLGLDVHPGVVQRALSQLGNLTLDINLTSFVAPLADAPPAGGACFTCATFFSPGSPLCRSCGSPSVLQLPGPPPPLLLAISRLLMPCPGWVRGCLSSITPGVGHPPTKKYIYIYENHVKALASPPVPPPKKKKIITYKKNQGESLGCVRRLTQQWP